MRKIYQFIEALILTTIMLLSLCACGSKDVHGNSQEDKIAKIKELISDGYICLFDEFDEDSFRAVFFRKYENDKVCSYYKIVAQGKVPSEQREAYYSIAWEDDLRREQCQEILASLNIISITDVSDRVPTREELDSYIGKTIGEMESLGYAESGWQHPDPNGVYFFQLDGPFASINATVEDPGKAMETCSEEEILALTITDVGFSGLSESILYE